MRRVLIVIALFAVAAVSLWYLWGRMRNRNANTTVKLTPTPTTSIEKTQKTIEDKFRVTLPTNVQKTDLKDVSGGNGSAIATKKYENGRFESTILADLPDPTDGKQYYAWVTKGEEGKDGYDIVYLGPLQMAKGGYLLDYQVARDLTSYNRIIISLGKTTDNKPEKIVLQGSF